jgi:hypothetical protein
VGAESRKRDRSEFCLKVKKVESFVPRCEVLF